MIVSSDLHVQESDALLCTTQHPEKEFLLRASYLEIYNETLKDLLDPTAGPVKVRQDEQKRFFVHPLREEVVTTEAQVAALLRRGAENRHVGQTDFNERSSRSHSVFQMVRVRFLCLPRWANSSSLFPLHSCQTIESRDDPSFAPAGSVFTSPPSTPRRPGAIQTPNTPRLAPGTDGVVRMSRLSLIDLAGSEQATSQMERRSEGAFINKSCAIPHPCDELLETVLTRARAVQPLDPREGHRFAHERGQAEVRFIALSSRFPSSLLDPSTGPTSPTATPSSRRSSSRRCRATPASRSSRQ